jgi:hypothetical protein
MYRIRSSSGEEAVFKTLEEFNAAVRSGIIAAEDEIFHSRANKWLDVKSHPHYRSALGLGEENGNGHAPRFTPPGSAKPTLSPFGVQAVPPSLSKPARQHSGQRPAIGTAPHPATGDSQKQPALTSSGVRPALTQVRPPLNSPTTAPKLTMPSAPAAVATNSSVAVEPVAAPQSSQPQAAAPAAPAETTPPPKPKKSKELLFLDVDLPKPKPAPKPEPAQDEFLIAGDGIDSPIRNSSGHRTVNDSAPVDVLPGPELAQDKNASTKPAENGGNVWTPTLDRSPFSNIAVQPSVPKPRAHVDLDVEAPQVEPAQPPAPIHHRPEKSKMGLLAGGVGALALLGVVAFWKPWASNGSSTAATTVATAADPGTAGTTAAGKPANGSQLVQTANAQSTPNTGKPVPAGQQNPAAGAERPVPAPVDSGQSEQIVAAVRPDFRSAKLDMSTPDVEVAAITSGGSGIAPSELTRRYGAAATAVREDLYSKLMAAGFIRIFSASRLSTSEGITDAASAWSAGSEAITQYRTRITRIEKAYDDSVLASQRSGKWPANEMRAWAGRASYVEPTDLTQASDLMFKQVSALLALLDKQQGQFEVKGGAFAFKDLNAKQEYNAKRIWIAQRMDSWSSTPESARPLTVTQVLKALGDGLPGVQ